MDDTLLDTSLEAEALRLAVNVVLDGKVLDVTSLWLTVNAALKAETVDEDKDPVVESDWLSKNSKDDTSRLTEYKLVERTLVEEDTLKPTDWDWVSDLLLGNHAL